MCRLIYNVFNIVAQTTLDHEFGRLWDQELKKSLVAEGTESLSSGLGRMTSMSLMHLGVISVLLLTKYILDKSKSMNQSTPPFMPVAS